MSAGTRKRFWTRDLTRGIGVAAAAGVVLTVTGAFGTINVPFGLRLAYWMILMVGGGVWGEVCSRILDRFVALDERPWLNVLLLTAMMSGPVTAVVWALTGPMLNGRPPMPLAHIPMLAGYVIMITAVISAINVFMTRSQPVQTHAGPADRPAARFPDRLPPRLKGATIHAVQAEDHYLRIHTDRGSDLILLRLSDALEELEGLEGAQTHRSWWVAKGAVRDVSRGDGRAMLSLPDGLSAPVSRRYARALRSAGWY